MICPQCESEYIDGVSVCPECDIPLVDELLRAHEPVDRVSTPEPVVVFSSYDASLIAIAKSVLQSSDIVYGVAGEEVQDLFGYGRFPSGGSLFIGPTKLLVAAADGADAKAILAVLSESSDPVVHDTGIVEIQSEFSWWSMARKVGKLVAALLLVAIVAEWAWLLWSQ